MKFAERVHVAKSVLVRVSIVKLINIKHNDEIAI